MPTPGLKTPVLRPHLAAGDLGPQAERVEEEQEIDLLEDEDEAIGDRIMEVAEPPTSLQDMNGMKEKFDVALKRIGDEIEKDQAEQDEALAGE